MGLVGAALDLPPGSWSIVGKGPASDITEDEAKGLVGEVMPFGRVKRFKDYEFVESAFYEAPASLASWVRSEGFEIGKVVILKLS